MPWPRSLGKSLLRMAFGLGRLSEYYYYYYYYFGCRQCAPHHRTVRSASDIPLDFVYLPIHVFSHTICGKDTSAAFGPRTIARFVDQGSLGGARLYLLYDSVSLDKPM